MEKVSTKEIENRWRRILKRKRSAASLQASDYSSTVDPFDCSDLIIPSRRSLVQKHIDLRSREWQSLDERRVSSKSDEETSQRVKLPKDFDYSTKLPQPPPEDDDSGDRVVSLEDPTKTFSYEKALWRVFAKLPAADELETEQLMDAKITNSLRVKDEITEGALEYTRLDGHAIGRLRLADRHSLPEEPICQEHELISTLTFECLRSHPYRGCFNDPNRLVIEVPASETLLYLHRILCELSKDPFWEDQVASDHQASNEEQGSGDPAQLINSGVFFVENVFYTFGAIDYSEPLQEYLTAPGFLKRNRRLNVEMSPQKFSMKETKLEDLELRLGVRYLHVCHDNEETTVFLVDRRLANPRIKFPLFHDIWTPTCVPPFCWKCNNIACRIACVDKRTLAFCRDCINNMEVESIDYRTWDGKDLAENVSEEK